MSLFDGKAERFLPCFLTLVDTFRSSAKVGAGAVELVDEAGGPVAAVVGAGAVELVDEAGGPVAAVVGAGAVELVDEAGGPVAAVVGTAEDKSTWTVTNIKNK